MNNLAVEKLEKFFSQFKTIHYKKGEVIIRPGDIPPGVYLLKKGYVKLYSISSQGEELTLIIFKADDFFPITWAINGTPNTQYLEAMTAIEAWRAPKLEFLEFLKNNSDSFFELTSRMLVRLRGLMQRMEYLAFGNAYEKVASILLICAERFGEQEGGNIVIKVPLTHKDIAALLGITRETASIEIKKLERKGLIAYHGRSVVVEDKKGLEQESLLTDF